MTNPMTVTALQTAKREIRKRVRRQVMLRRLRRELSNGEEIVEVFRRPTNR